MKLCKICDGKRYTLDEGGHSITDCPTCCPAQPQEAAEPVNEHAADSLTYALSASLARAGRKTALNSFYGSSADPLPTVAYVALDTGKLLKHSEGDQHNNLHIPLCRKDTAKVLLSMQKPAPDVPELETVGLVWKFSDAPWRYEEPFFRGVNQPRSETPDHRELVLRDNAAVIIAAKDARNKELHDLGHESFKIAVSWQERALAAEAKLAQIEAQKPVAWLCEKLDGDDRFSKVFCNPLSVERIVEVGVKVTPLFALPTPAADPKIND